MWREEIEVWRDRSVEGRDRGVEVAEECPCVQ